MYLDLKKVWFQLSWVFAVKIKESTTPGTKFVKVESVFIIIKSVLSLYSMVESPEGKYSFKQVPDD